jgi:hypothetical protein
MAGTGVAGLVDVCLLALIMGIVLQTVWVLKKPTGSTERQEEEMRLIFNAIVSIGVLAWPIVFDMTVGLNKLMMQPRLLIGFAWPICVLLTELQYVCQLSAATGQKGRAVALFQHTNLNTDIGSIIAIAIAMGRLLLGKSKNFPLVSQMIMYAMVFCIAFVVPTLQVPPETKEAVMWRSIQKIMLTYAIGFTVSGISADLLKDVVPMMDGDSEVLPPTAEERALEGGLMSFRTLPHGQ